VVTAGCFVVAPGRVSAGRSNRTVCIPVSWAASSSASDVAQEHDVLGGVRIVREIVVYDRASRLCPMVVSK